MSKPNEHTIIMERNGRDDKAVTGTIPYLIEYFGYTLEVGASWNKKVNRNPKGIKTLITNLNRAKCASAANGCPDTWYRIGGNA